MNNFTHIIVQAGGKGTRMEQLTRNKPKSLVPVENLPMIFHLFKKFPDKKFVIIGDYKFDVLSRYLNTFAHVDYALVNAFGQSGTCAGIATSLDQIPADTAFMLVWSDLVLPSELEVPVEDTDYIGISKGFTCRWSYSNGKFEEVKSDMQGVAGFFVFRSKSALSNVPDNGELVRWLQGQDFSFTELPLYHTKEFGTLSEYNKLPMQKCRPFNKITIDGDCIIKEAVDNQGEQLAKREVGWYRKLNGLDLNCLPKIFSYEPLTMEKVNGKNVYEYDTLSYNQKIEILRSLISCLKEIHDIEHITADKKSFDNNYIDKTFDRLEKIRNLVPFANDEIVRVNGKNCRNVFQQRSNIENLFDEYFPKQFKIIHGDCTFSNIMLYNDDMSPVLIDPRGYFGLTEYYGDMAYDWAKLYYSIVGNYDRFNLKHFDLTIDSNEVFLKIESNNWEDVENEFFKLLSNEVTKPQIQLIHAIIWLSLTTYAWEDYDSICGAFYNGLYYLEDVL